MFRRELSLKGLMSEFQRASPRRGDALKERGLRGRKKEKEELLESLLHFSPLELVMEV